MTNLDITISKKEIKEYEKLKIISQASLVKEKIKLFETKYNCDFKEFEEEIQSNQEDFQKWDDFIEWKAYYRTLDDLNKKMAEIENAENIRIT